MAICVEHHQTPLSRPQRNTYCVPTPLRARVFLPVLRCTNPAPEACRERYSYSHQSSAISHPSSTNSLKSPQSRRSRNPRPRPRRSHQQHTPTDRIKQQKTEINAFFRSPQAVLRPRRRARQTREPGGFLLYTVDCGSSYVYHCMILITYVRAFELSSAPPRLAVSRQIRTMIRKRRTQSCQGLFFIV
jgi:hypothetical protein